MPPVLRLQLKLFLIFTCWFGLILILINTSWMRITSIECQLASSPGCDEALETELDHLIGSSIIDLKLDKIIQNNTVLQSTYQLVQVQKYFPNHVFASFATVELIYFIEFNQTKYLVNYQGKLLPYAEIEVELPQILGHDQQLITEPNQAEPTYVRTIFHQQMMSIIELAQRNGVEVRSVNYVSNHQIELLLKPELRVVIDGDQVQTNFIRLKIILESRELSEQLGPDSVIDLRFVMPIVRDHSTQGS